MYQASQASINIAGKLRGNPNNLVNTSLSEAKINVWNVGVQEEPAYLDNSFRILNRPQWELKVE